MKYQIPFNKPYLTGKEAHYIYQAVYSGKLSGNGLYTRSCQDYFKERYGFQYCLLTSSCTDALEMSAILADISPGDEVIVPSYTFVSTANAFVLRGAKIVFADSRKDHPCIDADSIEELITSKTKAIVPVHYAGVACDMDKIMYLANKYNILVIEDAAQAIDSYYIDRFNNKKPLGSIGHLATFSFHETKNIIAGEGGMLVVNDKALEKRAEIIWEKGTNRSAFFRGEVDKYNWVDLGSSYLPSEVTAAFLYAQLEHLEQIQQKRQKIWQRYYDSMSHADLGRISLPYIPDYATNNAHMFYLICQSEDERFSLIKHLKDMGIWSVFHYLSLHKSTFSKQKAFKGGELVNSDRYTDCLIRLPLFYELQESEIDKVIDGVLSFD